MNGVKRGDAVADQWRDKSDRNRRERELAIERLRQRANMRSNPDEEEDTGVIERRALEAQRRKDSEPPSGKARVAVSVLKLLPEGWGRVLVVLAAIAAVTYLVGKGTKLW